MAYIIGTKEQCELYDAHVTQIKNYKGVTTRWAEPMKHPVQELWSIVQEPSVPVFSEDDNPELLIEGMNGVVVVKQLPEDWTEDVDGLIE